MFYLAINIENIKLYAIITDDNMKIYTYQYSEIIQTEIYVMKGDFM